MVSAGVGVLGAILFSFALTSNIRKLISHDILGLPGPGAGIAILTGPYLILLCFVARGFLYRRGFGGLTCGIFGVAVFLLDRWLGNVGMHGSWTLLEVAGCLWAGVAFDLVGYCFRQKPSVAALFAESVWSNVLVLIGFWVAVLPTIDGWVKPKVVPVLLLASAISACVVGIMVYAASLSRFSRRTIHSA